MINLLLDDLCSYVFEQIIQRGIFFCLRSDNICVFVDPIYPLNNLPYGSITAPLQRITQGWHATLKLNPI